MHSKELRELSLLICSQEIVLRAFISSKRSISFRLKETKQKTLTRCGNLLLFIYSLSVIKDTQLQVIMLPFAHVDVACRDVPCKFNN